MDEGREILGYEEAADTQVPRRVSGFPEKGEELVGLVDGVMVKYLVRYSDPKSRTVRLEVLGTMPAPKPSGLLQDVINLVEEGGAPTPGELNVEEDVVHDYWNRLLRLLMKT